MTPLLQLDTKCQVAMLRDHGGQSYTSWVAASPFRCRQTQLSEACPDCCLGPSLRSGARSQPGEAHNLSICCDSQTNQHLPSLRQASAMPGLHAPAVFRLPSAAQGNPWKMVQAGQVLICKITCKKLKEMLSQEELPLTHLG